MVGTRTKSTIAGRIFDFFNALFLILFTLSILYPFWNMILQSFSPVEEVTSLGFHIWLKNWSFGSWRYIFSNNEVGRAYLNTLHRVLFGTAFALLVTFTAAYGLSKRDLPGRSAITMAYVLTMFFGGGLIPTYLLVRNLGLMNSRWVLVILPALNVFHIIIARNFLMTIDQAMEDSALIDGANYWTILFRIMIPLSKPILATILLWTSVFHWNAWFDALIYINDYNKKVLQLLVQQMYRDLRPSELDAYLDQFMDEITRPEPIALQAVQSATVLVTIGPIILTYPFIQRHFVKGIMIGSLKG